MSCCKTSLITEFSNVAGATSVLMARAVKSDATNIVQADVDSIRVDVYRIDGEELTAIDSAGEETEDPYAEPAASDVVFDTLQEGGPWSKDSEGYNVLYKIITPARDYRYEVRISLTLTNADVIVLPYLINSR